MKKTQKMIYIPHTKYCKILSSLSLLLLIGTFIYLLIVWGHLPDELPAHYNGAGEIDRWGSKYELLICPIIALLMQIGISALERRPEIWNTGVEITKRNEARIYSVLKNMIVTMKFTIIFTFTSLTVNSSLARPLPSWFTPAYLIFIFGPMAYFLILIYKKR